MSLRWGILATGKIARMFTSDLIAEGLDVRAVGSRSLPSARAFAEEFGIPRTHGSYEALANDPDIDIVYVATPHPMHAENAELALRAGKHALVEKAFTLNRGEAEGLRELARDRGLLVMEAMWTRYLPGMRRVREIVQAGTLGDIRSLTADHSQSISTDPLHRLNDLSLGGGALLDLGIYPVSFAWDILGAPTTIQAAARLGDTGADAEVATLMTHASGALSTSVSSSRSKGTLTAHVVGTEARIDMGPVWYASSPFTVTTTNDEVIERFEPEHAGRGMQFQAIEAERLIAEGRTDGDILPIDESVEIIGTLDEIRRTIGVSYPSEADHSGGA